MTDRACAGWACALQRHAREFLTLHPGLAHADDRCTPCRPDTGFFICTDAPTCLNLCHYDICGRTAIHYLLRRAMPTEYDIDVLRSQSAGMAVAQQELEATRRAMLSAISARIQSMVDSRETTALLLRAAFAKRRAIFHLLGKY